MIDGLNIPYMHIKPPCKVKDLATAGRCSAKGVMRHVPRSVHHMYNARCAQGTVVLSTQLLHKSLDQS